MCDCIDKVDAKLRAEHNRRLSGVAFFLDGRPSRIAIQMEPVEKKRGERPGTVVAEFCPFCGQKYSDKAAA